MSLPSALKAAYGWVVGRDLAPMTRGTDPWDDSWFTNGWGVQSATGIRIDQATAMACATVMACVRMLAFDLAKAIPGLFEEQDGKPRREAKEHFLSDLLAEPNDWQTWFEFCSQMQMGLALRGNAYAVIVRDQRGRALFFVPVNPDKVALWEAPDGSLFYLVTRTGLHQMAMLAHEPLLIPARNILHLRGLSSNGLLGLSPISLAREAIGLSLAQEQQAARWMGNAAKPSGILTTDKKMSKEAYDRSKQAWIDAQAGLTNSGKTAMLEEGLKWQPMSMSSQDMEFIASRRYQDEEIARMFRIPIPMVTEVGSSARTDPDVLAQHYVNYTMSDYTSIWSSRLSKTFGLRTQNLRVGFDMSVLLQADLAARINMHRLAVLGGLETQNEGRAGIGHDRMEGADVLLTPSNSTPYGSDHSGNAPDGAGAPSAKKPNPDQAVK